MEPEVASTQQSDEPSIQDPLTQDVQFLLTFHVVVPENVQSVCVVGDIPELGSWKEPIEMALAPGAASRHFLVRVAMDPEGKMDSRHGAHYKTISAREFEYKFLQTYNDGSFNWEEGPNRKGSCKGQELFCQYRRRQEMHHHQGMWWGGYSHTKTEEHAFLVFLREMMRDARTAEPGKYDIAAALKRYRTLEKNLMREGDLVSKDINTVLRSYVGKLAVKRETGDGGHTSSMDVPRMMLALAVLSTTDNLPYEQHFFSPFGGGSNMMYANQGMNMGQGQYGSSGWNRPDLNELTHCLLEALRDCDYEHVYNNIVKKLTSDMITDQLLGLRFLLRKLQWYDDYVWLFFVPFIQVLSHHGARSIKFAEPDVNRYHHAPRNFSETLREVRKQDCLLFDTHVGPERFPILKVLISQAPSLESLLEVANFQTLESEALGAYRNYCRHRLADYKWTSFRADGDIADCIKLLNSFDAGLALDVIDAILKNDDFEHVELNEALPLLFLADKLLQSDGTPTSITASATNFITSILGGASESKEASNANPSPVPTSDTHSELKLNEFALINEKFACVCRSLTQWLFRKFNDTKHSLSKVIFKINHVMKMRSLSQYEAAFSAALSKILALYDDRQILTKELNKQPLAEWEPGVVKLFTERAVMSVQTLAVTEGKQVKVFLLLQQLDGSKEELRMMKMLLLTRLLTFSCGGELRLENVLGHSSLWVHFIQFCGNNDVNFNYDCEFESWKSICGQLKALKDKFVVLAESINAETCNLGDLKILLEHQERCSDLMRSLKIRLYSDEAMDNCRSTFERFEEKISQLQTFCNVFGGPLDVAGITQINDRIISFRKQWDTLILKEVKDVFNDLCIIPHLPWLFQLRGSEMFLALWKKLGRGKDLIECLTHSMLDLNDLNALVGEEAMVQLTSVGDATNASSSTASTTNTGVTTPLANPSPVNNANQQAQPVNANANVPVVAKPVVTNASSSTSAKSQPSATLSDRTYITCVLDALKKKHAEEMAKYKLISSQGDDDEVPDLFSSIFDEKVQLLPTAPQRGRGGRGGPAPNISQKTGGLRQTMLGSDNSDEDFAYLTTASSSTMQASHGGKLTMLAVTELLLKAVAIEWNKLYTALNDCTISFQETEKIFEKIKTKKIEKEITTMRITCVGSLASRALTSPTSSNPLAINNTNTTSDSVDAEQGLGGGEETATYRWVRVTTGLVLDHRVLQSYKKRLSGLLVIASFFKQHFLTNIEEGDERFHSLLNINKTFDDSWPSLTLSDVRSFVYVKDIFDNFSKNHLQYLDELAKGESLIKWFFSQASTEEFSQLISITKSNTDDAISLRAIASLQSTRNKLAPLLYPASTFISFQAFIDVFVKIPIEDKDVVVQLATANEKFEFLLKIFAEKTRSPGIQAVYDLKDITDFGTYCWRAVGAQKGLLLQFGASEGKRKGLALDELIDLRNRLMLAKIPKELESEEGITELIRKFVDQLKVLIDISDSLEALVQAGHFLYLTFEITFRPKDEISHLHEREQFYRTELATWNAMVSEMRTRHYYLNFFTIERIVNLLENLDEGNLKQVYSILRSIHTQFDRALLVDAHGQAWKKVTEPKERFEQLGNFLSQLLSPIPPLVRLVRNVVTPGSRYLFEADAQGLYTLTVSSEKVLDLVLTLYIQQGRIPEPDEVLFCNRNTTIEQLVLVLYRWAHAKKNNRKDRLFSIVNVEQLWYTTQTKVVDFINSLDTTFCASLAFVCGSTEGQHILSAFYSRRVTVVPLESAMLNDIYGKLCCKGYLAKQAEQAKSNITSKSVQPTAKTSAQATTNSNTAPLASNIITASTSGNYNVMSYSSNMAGAGKTRSIQSFVSTSKSHYIHIPIVGPTSIAEIIALLTLNNTLSEDDPRSLCYHIDIGPTAAYSELNDVLFQLVVTGMLVESGCIFHKRDKDVFCIELANLFAAHAHHDASHSFIACLPSHEVTVGPDTMDIDRFEERVAKDGTSTFDIVPNYELQFVCKYLQAFNNQEFVNFEATSEDFHPDVVEDLMASDCFALLSQFLCVDGTSPSDISFVIISNFVKFAYQQFLNITYYDLLTNVAVAGALGCPAFKNFIIDFVIKTAIDVSMRAIDNSTATQTNPLRLSSSLRKVNNLSESQEFALKFDRMRHWEDSDHPFVVLQQADTQLSDILAGGIGIISLNPRLVDTAMDRNMKAILQLNGFQFDTDYTKISRLSAMNLLRAILGVSHNVDPQPHYVLTFDNLMKMLAIQLRIKCDIPAIIMGETGCGKTALVSYLCEFINVPLFVMDVHGGITDEYIKEWMEKPIQHALSHPRNDVYIFFDEINTCNSMSLFKNITCDRTFNQKHLPNNIKFIAACNPYRLIEAEDNESERIGLTFEQKNSLEVIPDPLAKLVYRVHPLPQTLLEFVWDFGTLPANTEQLYIKSILMQKYAASGDKSATKSDQSAQQNRHPSRLLYDAREEEKVIDFLTRVISVSHTFLRNNGFTVSLRDVSRVIRLINWFTESFLNRNREIERKSREGLAQTEGDAYLPSDVILKKSYVLALTHCYHSRLNELRPEYRSEITRVSRENNAMRLSGNEYQQIVLEEQHYYANRMVHQGSGIALNEALCENIFMTLVCILNKIPIFIVGKPGSSKSLSIELIGSNLKGKMSTIPFFQNYPAVEVFSYQCSPLSTSHGIEQTFHHAIRYQANASNTIVVVLLDEVGLAEQSTHLPLKVLHKLLEKPEVAVVGISNWTLDRAKMNRAIHLTRPQPTVEDLKDTAMGIISNEHLRANLLALAESYYHVYHVQSMPDFFGLRDYYHLIKFLHRNLEDSVTFKLLDVAVRRNFGGISETQQQAILHEFLSRVGITHKPNAKESPSIVSLIESNIKDRNARHLMLLTHNDSALSLLFDRHLLALENTVVLFGSDFPQDRSDLYIFLNIQTIKSCMAKGKTIVLIHADNLYESLYDLLNQHYTEYQGQRYVRLALGTSSKLCPIHNDFRVVVIVECQEAYTKLAPPLLNRFEKQVFTRECLLSPVQRLIVSHLEKFISAFVDGVRAKGVSCQVEDVFVGYHSDSLSSLLLALATPGKSAPQLLQESIQALVWLCRPEYIILSQPYHWVVTQSEFQDENEKDEIEREAEEERKELKSSLAVSTDEIAETQPDVLSFSLDFKELYYTRQRHEDLPEFLSFAFSANTKSGAWGDETGLLCMVLTFSPLSDYSDKLFDYYPAQTLETGQADSTADGTKTQQDLIKEYSITQGRIEALKQAMERQGVRASEPSASEPSRLPAELVTSEQTEAQGDLGERMKELEAQRDALIEQLKAVDTAEKREIAEGPKEGSQSLNQSSEVKKEDSYKIPLCLKLHDFSSEGELIHTVQRFFATPASATIIIQCDPVAVSNQRIVHAKYICEKEKSEFQKKLKNNPQLASLKKHIIFLVNLNRISTTFTFDFDKRFHYCLIDDIRPSALSKIPSSQELLHGSELELLKTELKQTLKSKFRMCLAKLLYPYERNSHQIQMQIEMMLHLFEYEDFAGVLLDRLTTLMEATIEMNASSSKVSWQEQVAANKQDIVMAGTLRSALFERLTSTVTRLFMLILCNLDRNSNISLFWNELAKENKEMVVMWLSIFKDPMLFPLAIPQHSGQYEPRYDVISDGQQGSFVAQFPFSFVFIHAVEAMREEESKMGANVEQTIERLIHSLFGTFFDRYSSPAHIDRYFADYVRIYGHQSLVDHEAQTLITREIIEREQEAFEATHPGAKKQLTVGTIHAFHWRNELRLSHVFRVLDLFRHDDTIVTALLQLLKTKGLSLPAIDLAIVELVLKRLMPEEKEWLNTAAMKSWMTRVSYTHASVQAFLKGNPLSEQCDRLKGQWERIIFLSIFVRDVAIPLAVSHKTSLAMSNIIWNGNFATKATFDDSLALLLSLHDDSGKGDRKTVINQLAEKYIMNFCLAEKRDVEPALQQELFCSLLFDKASLKPSVPLKSFLFTQLLTTYAASTALIDKIETLLAKDLESPSHVVLVRCVEDLEAQKDFALTNARRAERLVTTLAEVDEQSLLQDGASTWRKMLDIGKVKYFLVHLSNAIVDLMTCNQPIPEGYVKQANRLLNHFAKAQKERLFSPKIFILQHIARIHGNDFVQTMMNSSSLQELFPWLLDLRQNDDKMLAFVRKRHIFERDPFHAHPGYAESKQVIQKILLGGSLDLLKTHVTTLQSKSKSSLLLAIFMEVTLQYTMSTAVPKHVKELVAALKECEAVIPPTLLTIYEWFCYNTVPIPELRFSPSSAPKQVFHLSCIVHILGLALSPSQECLYNLLMSPTELGKYFIPTMPNDERLALMEVLGGGWYECPKGHSYYVSECGRPTQEYTCPTCGSKIGGLDHNLDTTNKVSEKVDKSLTGYLLSSSDLASGLYSSVRTLAPNVFRFLRFFIHVLLYFGSNISEDLHAQVKLLTGCQQENVHEFLEKLMTHDWDHFNEILHRNAEDTAAVFHILSASMTACTNNAVLSLCATKEERVANENLFITTHCQPVFDNIEEALKRYYKNEEKDNSILSYLRESIDLKSLSLSERKAQLLSLWSYRQNISMAHLKSQLQNNVQTKEKFPLLALFVMEEERYRYLKHLHQAVQWQTFLVQKFDKRIERSFANNTTIEQVLAELSEVDQRRGEIAFRGFQEAWNGLWTLVDRYTCMEIPADWKNIVMSKHTKLCFSLAAEKDEGICALALMNFMVDQHNSIFNVWAKLEGNQEHPYKVPSRCLKPLHLIDYSVEADLLPFIQSQVEQQLEYGKGHEVVHNFAKIQQHIIDTILAGRPQIVFEVKKFSFANETRAEGALAKLKQRVPQVGVSAEGRAKILEELASNLPLLQHVLRLLEIALGFLSATTSSLSGQGDQGIADYLKHTLLLPEAMPSSIEKYVQLRHVEWLWRLLEDQLGIDPFRDVNASYKKSLSMADAETVRRMAPKLELKILLPEMKKCLIEYLDEESTIGTELSMVDVLGPIELANGDELGSFEFFQKHFARELKCKYFLEVYKLLLECQ